MHTIFCVATLYSTSMFNDKLLHILTVHAGMWLNLQNFACSACTRCMCLSCMLVYTVAMYTVYKYMSARSDITVANI